MSSIFPWDEEEPENYVEQLKLIEQRAQEFNAQRDEPVQPKSVSSQFRSALEQYPPEVRQRIIEKFAASSGPGGFGSGNLWAGIGAAISGGDVSKTMSDNAAADRAVLTDNLDFFDAGRKGAIENATLSKTAQDLEQGEALQGPYRNALQLLFTKQGRGEVPSDWTEERIQKVLDPELKLAGVLKPKAASTSSLLSAQRFAHQQEREQFEDDRRERERGEDEARRSREKQEAADLTTQKEHRQVKEELETQLRFANDLVDLMIKDIGEHGTTDVTGPFNDTMRKRSSDLATALAKIADPKSVAMPGEVEREMKGLFEPGLFQQSSTAIARLKDVKRSMAERKKSAYAARGLPLGDSPETPPVAKDRKVVKRFFSKATGKTKLVYDDGSEEIVDGR